VAPLVTLTYGLSERESEVTRLCMEGLSTRQMAHALGLSPLTVQDHLKSIFAKTGARTRSELVSQIFLEHYVPRWEDIPDGPVPDPARTPRSWPDRFTLSSPPRRLTDRAPGTKRSRVQIQSPRPVECLIGCTSR